MGSCGRGGGRRGGRLGRNLSRGRRLSPWCFVCWSKFSASCSGGDDGWEVGGWSWEDLRGGRGYRAVSRMPSRDEIRLGVCNLDSDQAPGTSTESMRLKTGGCRLGVIVVGSRSMTKFPGSNVSLVAFSRFCIVQDRVVAKTWGRDGCCGWGSPCGPRLSPGPLSGWAGQPPIAANQPDASARETSPAQSAISVCLRRQTSTRIRQPPIKFSSGFLVQFLWFTIFAALFVVTSPLDLSDS